MIAFGLTLDDAWRLTLPDYAKLLKAHNLYHSPPKTTDIGPPMFTPEEAEQLHAEMREAAKLEEETEWRSV